MAASGHAAGRVRGDVVKKADIAIFYNIFVEIPPYAGGKSDR